jgi:small-conductance mechanosensitive channel
VNKLFSFEEIELSKVWSLFLSVWNFQVFSVDNNGVSFGKIVVGLALFLVGIEMSRRIANKIERRFLSRLDVDPSMRYNIRSMIFYVLLVFVALFVLRLLNIPLTVFAVVGGALAIGVGFGSQNIVNNFISGLILMIEQPIRIGDYIEADNVAGTIDRIGARSTRVRSGANTQIVVPNSYFLEKIINNWTLKDRRIRYKVSVIAEYGSDTRMIAEHLRHLLVGVPGVVSAPAPEVVFSDLGPYGAVFEMSYTAEMDGPNSPSQINTELRHRVHEDFSKSGIRFAVYDGKNAAKK